jgi:hypothetical protein
LERTPSVAAKAKEEEIRDLLLVGLNAQFQRDAGGELFNGAGKTDILIRVEDRNIFIGECRVWSGPKTMDDALEQLFGYLVWRDTKAAILLSIRNKDVSAVMARPSARSKSTRTISAALHMTERRSPVRVHDARRWRSRARDPPDIDPVRIASDDRDFLALIRGWAGDLIGV